MVRHPGPREFDVLGGEVPSLHDPDRFSLHARAVGADACTAVGSPDHEIVLRPFRRVAGIVPRIDEDDVPVMRRACHVGEPLVASIGPDAKGPGRSGRCHPEENEQGSAGQAGGSAAERFREDRQDAYPRRIDGGTAQLSPSSLDQGGVSLARAFPRSREDRGAAHRAETRELGASREASRRCSPWRGAGE